MARAGRKRKDTIRKAGRIDWWAEREDPAMATKWHLARNRLKEVGGDTRLASQAGKLFCLRHLTATEMEAADRWTKMLAEYDRLILSMARTPRPAPLERVSPGEGYIPTPEQVDRFLGRFQPAQNAILKAGKPSLAALNRLCRDEASTTVLPEARKALDQLAAHFRLIPVQKHS